MYVYHDAMNPRAAPSSVEICDNALPLERVFNNSVSRVLDFLINNQKFDYSESDISRLANVPSRTLQRVLPRLKFEKLVTITRKSGKQNMYTLNAESERALALRQYAKSTIRENLDNSLYLKNKKN